MKKLLIILPLVLILCFMVGCEHRAALVELEKFQTQAKVEEQNKALVQQFYDELDKHNLEVFKELCVPNVQLYFPGSFEPLNLEAITQLVTAFYDAFPNYDHSIEEMIAEGDKVMAKITNRATHEGEFMGVPPTGNDFAYGELILFQIKDGKIVEAYAQEDMLWMMQQLGMELKPKE